MDASNLRSDVLQQQLALEAIELQLKFDAAEEALEAKKQELRALANGKTLNIVVPGSGKVDVTEPRAGTTKSIFSVVEEKLLTVPALRRKLVDTGVAKEVLVIDEVKLAAVPDLRSKLLQKGVLAEEVKKVSAAKASVRIQPNA